MRNTERDRQEFLSNLWRFNKLWLEKGLAHPDVPEDYIPDIDGPQPQTNIELQQHLSRLKEMLC